MRLLFVLNFVAAYGLVQQGNTPIEKVIELLGDMRLEAQNAAKAERDLYTDFQNECADYIQAREKAMKTSQREIDGYTASISRNNARIKDATSEIQGHESDVADWSNDIKAATAVRAYENGEFKRKNSDLDGTLKALNEAMELFKDDNGNEEVESIMKDLKHELSESQADLQYAEKQSVGAYNILNTDREDAIASAKTSINEKTKARAGFMEQVGESTREKNAASEILASSTQAKNDRESTCKSQKAVFEENQKVRADEIESIYQALRILESPEARTGTGHTRLLLQVGTTTQVDRAYAILYKAGKTTGSSLLQTTAAAVQGGPFDKVINMVKTLITRLQKESAEETAHKAECDKKLAENEESRKKTYEDLVSAHNEWDGQKATIDEKTQQKNDNSDTMAQNSEELQKATKQRREENAENTKVISETKVSEKAVGDALKVLRDFYDNAASFIQEPEDAEKDAASASTDEGADDEGMKGFASYGGQQQGNKGVVGLLETILTDCARVISDTTSAENNAQAEYDAFAQDMDKQEKTLTRANENLSLGILETQQEQELTTSKLEGLRKNLDQYIKLYTGLEADCLQAKFNPMRDFATRNAKRDEEIESLKAALSALE